MNDALLQELLERVRGRYYGKYRGVVVDIDATTMRVKASVPSVLPGAPTGWCMACVSYAGPNVGVVMLPEIGSGVWIEFEGGDVSYPIWTGCFWHAGEVPAQASATVKSLIAASGSLAMDDDAGSITITDKQQNTVVLDSNGVTSTSGSAKVAIGASGVSVNDGALEVS
jgi:uncharacterized protein involved in type VI secretion and phage assembly